MKSRKIEKVCGNCRLYNNEKGNCGVAILIEGEQKYMPVFPSDNCHMDELGVEINQVRWWVEDEKGKQTEGNGTVKIEYPEKFFGNEYK